MKRRQAFPTLVLLTSIAAGCSESVDPSRELDKLTAEKDALETEVTQYRNTMERLETEVRTLMSENADLKDQLEIASLDLETAKKARSVEFVERVIERPASDSRGSGLPVPSGNPINPIDDDTGLQVLKASARATEKNQSWWRFGWVVTIANHSMEPRDFNLQVQLMDVDGFVVDDATAHSLTVPPMGSKTFRDSTLVDASVAHGVNSVNPVIKN